MIMSTSSKAACCILAVALLATSPTEAKRSLLQPALPSLPGSGDGSGLPDLPTGPGTECLAMGRTLANGPCAQFTAYFKKDADEYVTLDTAAFQTAVNAAPVPSATCCSTARDFITSSCTCDRGVLDYAPNIGLTANAVKAVSRAAQTSSCSWQNNGGYIADPCQGESAESATAGRH